MYGKTPAEMAELMREAERRVRAGEPRAKVAHDLGVPLSTMSGWAHRGGWRQKDLVAVRNEERGRFILGLIDQVTAEERAKSEADAARMREALEASKAELEAMAPDGRFSGLHLPGAMGEGPVPARKLAMSMADSFLRQGQLEEADRAVRLAARFAEAEEAGGASEEARWREERERLMKWWAEKQTAYHKLHTAADFALEKIKASLEQEASRSADQCCPKCGRRMDFWPEEVERPDDDSGDDSGGAGNGDDSDDDSSKAGDDDDSSRKRNDDDFCRGAADDRADEAVRSRQRAAFGIGPHKG